MAMGNDPVNSVDPDGGKDGPGDECPECAGWGAMLPSEKLALEEIMSNPSMGEVLQKMPPLTDPRWLGWRKMQYIKTLGDGTEINIHYVGKYVKGVLKAVDDFKFK